MQHHFDSKRPTYLGSCAMVALFAGAIALVLWLTAGLSLRPF